MVSCLPASLSVLNTQRYDDLLSQNNALDEKIRKTKHHLDRLIQQQPHRKTHGGKSFREIKAPRDNSINAALKRIERLTAEKVTGSKNSKDYCEKLNLSERDLKLLHDEYGYLPYKKKLGGKVFSINIQQRNDAKNGGYMYLLEAFCQNDWSLNIFSKDEGIGVLPLYWHKKVLSSISQSTSVFTRKCIDSLIISESKENESNET